MIEEMRSWDIDDVNTYFSKLHGLEDIKLGEDPEGLANQLQN
jgi:hypothetical protein